MERINDSERDALDKLEEKIDNLQKQGNFRQTFEYMEQALVLRQKIYGADSDEIWKACKAAGEVCNLLSMTYLQEGNFDIVLEMLKKAEILTERHPAGRAATYNNFACYYRKKGKLHSALQCLEKSLKIESRLSHVQNPADTHINTCAVLSQLGRHELALEHAQTALMLLQHELLPQDGEQPAQPPQADRIAVLAIAYHNIGVEQEFLKKFEQSIISYQKGVEVAHRYLTPEHPVSVTLQSSLKAAQKASVVRQKNKLARSHK